MCIIICCPLRTSRHVPAKKDGRYMPPMYRQQYVYHHIVGKVCIMYVYHHIVGSVCIMYVYHRIVGGVCISRKSVYHVCVSSHSRRSVYHHNVLS